MAQIQYKFNKNDEYLTPPYAVYPIAMSKTPRIQYLCGFARHGTPFITPNL